MKTHELTSPALDWAVTKAKGYADFVLDAKRFREMHDTGHYNYSTYWFQGGPIIEREGINLTHFGPNHWGAHPAKGDFPFVYGSTPLIAAMRCFVSSKLGDEVELPEEYEMSFGSGRPPYTKVCCSCGRVVDYYLTKCPYCGNI